MKGATASLACAVRRSLRRPSRRPSSSSLPSSSPRRARRSVALAAALALAGAAAWALPIRFEHYSLDEGLSQATVYCVHQDRRGFLWVCTEDGLDRFDGYQFVTYRSRPGDASSLPADAIWALAEDDAGDLWVATDGGGLARWDHRTDRFERRRLPAEGAGAGAVRVVRTLLRDDGGLWIGTRGEGLWRLDLATGATTVYRHQEQRADSLADDTVLALARAADGALWVATDRGVDRFDPRQGTFAHHRHVEGDPSSLGDDRVRALMVDREGLLWVGTYGAGVSRLGRDGAFRHLRHQEGSPDSLPHDRVRSLFEDRAGRIWVGTADGLALVDPRTFRCSNWAADLADRGSMADDDVMAIQQDRSGMLWFGTRSGGLQKWNPSSWAFGHHPPAPHDLENGTVTSFAKDDAGRLWVGTLGGGLHLMERPQGAAEYVRVPLPKLDGKLSAFVASLLLDHRGVLWVGSLDHGLYRLRGDGTVEAFPARPEDPRALAAEGVTSLLEDGRGRIWVGTFGGGLHLLDPETGTFERFGADAGLPSAKVIAMAQAPDGALWVGMDSGGLARFDPSTRRFASFRHDPDDASSLPADSVFSVFVDGRGAVWAGTRGGGLAQLQRLPKAGERAAFRVFDERAGLANDVVYGIVPDERGRLWLSTNHGLSVLDPVTDTMRSYHVQDGLQAEEFTFGAHLRSEAGELLFGGVAGFNAFQPHDIEPTEQSPPVALTSVEVLGVPARGTPPFALDRLRLGHREDVVTFEFAALDFTAPRHNRYRYRLEGFDDKWRDLGAVRRVTYTNLEGGEYLLRVQAASAAGVWNENGLKLPVSVAVPPWKRWWALLSYGMLGGIVLFGYATVQRRELGREVQYRRRLEREVAERTSDLDQQNRTLETLNHDLLEASLTDPLTGLRNRRFLFEHIGEETSLVQRRYLQIAENGVPSTVFDLVFLIVDLDQFKAINDTCGHLAGDRVLMRMRDVLEAICRDSDFLIRWGGDEFLIIARDASPEHGSELAERIRQAIRDTAFEVREGQFVRATCSVGFACFPFRREEPSACSWEEVLSIADVALYAAKHTARDAWVGLLSAGGSSQTDVLSRLRREPQALIADGSIEVRASIPAATELVWS